MNRKIQIYLNLLVIVIMVSCISNAKKLELKTGDLLFKGKSGEGISEAIDRVTQTDVATHFSHVGLVKIVDDSIFVLHASTCGGTCQVSLREFLTQDGDSVEVTAYRLKEPWQTAISTGIKRAEEMLGKPYNFSYVMSDSNHYCSEFIYRAFASDSIFNLNPMTFKDPETENFFRHGLNIMKILGLKSRKENRVAILMVWLLQIN